MQPMEGLSWKASPFLKLRTASDVGSREGGTSFSQLVCAEFEG